MVSTPIVSWNVRGVNDPLKRVMISSGLRKFHPAIIALQETHLLGDNVGCLQYAWVGKSYHSTHTAYSRGVSVLIHKALAYQELDSLVDGAGRYVFIYCKVYTLTLIIAFIYIPPPFSREVLQLLLMYLAGKPDVPLLIMGDLNCYLDPKLDRHPPVHSPGGGRGTALSRLVTELGWTDFWRIRNPNTKQFSCFSKTHGSLSRIDLSIGTPNLLEYISKIEYFPRGVSDHSPVAVWLSAQPPTSLPKAPWKLNAFWLKLFNSPERISSQIELFFNSHKHLIDTIQTWEAFKAYLRGIFIAEIAMVKRNSSVLLEQVGDQVRQLELAYVTDPTESAREAWISAQDSLDRLRSSAAERKRFFSKQAFYEEGEKTGRLLAKIARSQQLSPAVGAIRTASGRVVNGLDRVLSELASFYKDLYAARDDYTDDELEAYLAGIDLPSLSEEARQSLEAPLTLEELQHAACSFPKCKAPGEDGIPMEVFTQYGEWIMPQLLEVFNDSLKKGNLPTSMTRANIILLLKPGKDPVDPGSYRPISLLQSDVKILAKALALRVNRIIESIIHPDQAGFMPHKSTATNLRRLFLNMQLQPDNKGSRALLSLDANKAFDSVGWRYLWAVLSKLGFGSRFIAWVKLLYASPKATIRMSGRMSHAFALGRGTRQGCPLSPLLFAIAIEPLAAVVRASQQITGFKYGDLHEKIMLYADDMMLFLGDTTTSLAEVTRIITGFGYFSGLTINWSKSALMLLDEGGEVNLPDSCSVPVTSSFKYLGIQISPKITEYCPLNIYPLLSRFRDKINTWNRLKMSLAGKANLIKMILMPQLLYFLHNSPIVIHLKIFRVVNTLFRKLLWNSGTPRIKLEQLQNPKDSGGLAVPNPWLYYIAAQLQQLVGSMNRDPPGSSAQLMLIGTGAETIPLGLEAQLFHKSNKLTPTLTLIQKVWNKGRQLQEVTGFTEYSPIWGNLSYVELAKLQQGPRWRSFGVILLSHIFSNGRLLTFSELQNKYNLPNNMYYSYIQLKHAVDTQGSATPWTLSNTPIFHLIQSSTETKGFISYCYQMLLMQLLKAHPTRAPSLWEQDVGPITGEQWEEILQSINICSLNVAQKVSQLYIILRVHYTPLKLYKMGRRTDPLCGRCERHQGDLIHLLWRCPKLHRYWSEVMETLNRVFQTTIPLDPIHCILGVLEDTVPEEMTRIAITRALFQARKLILLGWKSTSPPSVRSWITHMGNTLIMEKHIYQHRGSPNRFERIWAPWLDTPGLSPRELVMSRLLQCLGGGP